MMKRKQWILLWLVVITISFTSLHVVCQEEEEIPGMEIVDTKEGPEEDYEDDEYSDIDDPEDLADEEEDDDDEEPKEDDEDEDDGDDGTIPEGNDGDVIALDNSNFGSHLSSNSRLLVEFYAPWDEHCKALAPEYKKAAQELKEHNFLSGKVDATKEAELSDKYSVETFPTIYLFIDGIKRHYTGELNRFQSKSIPTF